MYADSLTVVVPAYDEESRLPQTLEAMVAGLSAESVEWEIVVSDDGSTDATADIARGWSQQWPVRLVSSPANRGKGAAIAAGIEAASHAVVVAVDADLPVSVPTMMDLARATLAAPLVVGSRRLPGSSVDPPQPVVRRVGGRLFRGAVAFMGYQCTSDPQCGVKALRRDELAAVLRSVRCSGFGFDVELIVRTQNAGFTVAELPVAWRHVEGSSLRPFRDAARTMAELAVARTRLDRRRPLRADDDS